MNAAQPQIVLWHNKNETKNYNLCYFAIVGGVSIVLYWCHKSRVLFVDCRDIIQESFIEGQSDVNHKLSFCYFCVKNKIVS